MYPVLEDIAWLPYNTDEQQMPAHYKVLGLKK